MRGVRDSGEKGGRRLEGEDILGIGGRGGGGRRKEGMETSEIVGGGVG